MHRSRALKQEQVASRQFRKTSALRILRRAVDHCQELIFLTDAEGVLQYVNPSCEIVTGYSSGELIEKNLTCIASEVPKGESWARCAKRHYKKECFAAAVGCSAGRE